MTARELDFAPGGCNRKGAYPHDWLIPMPGDTALVCSACPRVLDVADILPYQRSAILAAQSRRTRLVYERFVLFFYPTGLDRAPDYDPFDGL